MGLREACSGRHDLSLGFHSCAATSSREVNMHLLCLFPFTGMSCAVGTSSPLACMLWNLPFASSRCKTVCMLESCLCGGIVHISLASLWHAYTPHSPSLSPLAQNHRIEEWRNLVASVQTSKVVAILYEAARGHHAMHLCAKCNCCS